MTHSNKIDGPVVWGYRIIATGEFIQLGGGSVNEAWDWVWNLDPDDQFYQEDHQTTNDLYPIRLFDLHGVEWLFDDGEDGPGWVPLDGGLNDYVWPPQRLLDMVGDVA